MDKNAIVVVYKGDSPSMDCIRTVGEAVMRHTHSAPETVEVYTLDEKEIAGAIVAKAINTTRHKSVEYTPEEAAVIYLRFLVPASVGISELISTVSSRYIMAIMHRAGDEKLVNAVRAIGQGRCENISLKVREEYKFGTNEFNAIKTIYDACAGHIAG